MTRSEREAEESRPTETDANESRPTEIDANESRPTENRASDGVESDVRDDDADESDGGPVAAVVGGLGFLTRLPVGGSEHAWTAFRRSPWAFPVVGYPIGAAVAVVAVLPVPRPTVAVLAAVTLYAVTGVLHLDGVADLGDAAVVHGDTDDRRAVLKDTTVGVGAVAAVGVTLLALAFGLFGVAGLPVLATGAVVLAAEVGAKLGMAVAASVGRSPHEGLGSAFTDRADPRDAGLAGLAAVPAVAVAWIAGSAVVAGGALAAAVGAGILVRRWAAGLVGGTNGDVFGAVNEIGRVAGLHAGVILWTLS